jgi:hypothetical protein
MSNCILLTGVAVKSNCVLLIFTLLSVSSLIEDSCDLQLVQ